MDSPSAARLALTPPRSRDRCGLGLTFRQFKALVTHGSLFSLTTCLLQSDYPVDRPAFDGSPYPWENWDNLNRWNPSRPDLLRNWKTPTLVVHGENDFRHPVTEGLAVFSTLQALGTPGRFLLFPDEGSWVLMPENALKWHRVVFDWIKKYTTPSYEVDTDSNH